MFSMVPNQLACPVEEHFFICLFDNYLFFMIITFDLFHTT